MGKISVISGNTSKGLARRIAKKLDAAFIPTETTNFPDGESKITLKKIPKKSKIIPLICFFYSMLVEYNKIL